MVLQDHTFYYLFKQETIYLQSVDCCLTDFPIYQVEENNRNYTVTAYPFS